MKNLRKKIQEILSEAYDKLDNWVILTDYGQILHGSSQHETKDKAFELYMGGHGPIEELVAVKGSMMWYQGRVIGVELKDGRKLYCGDGEGVGRDFIDLSKIPDAVQYYQYGSDN